MEVEMKNPKDILKKIKSSVDGIPMEDVVFGNLREKKPKALSNKKLESESEGVTIENSEGLSLSNVKVDTISYSSIGKKKRIKKKEMLEEWGAFDFFRYSHEKYTKKYNKTWGLNIGGGSLEINRIKDKLCDVFGFCSNLILKDYIDFFFKVYMDKMIAAKGNFYFSQMSNDKIISEFYNSYNFASSFEAYTKNKKELDKCEISDKSVFDSFSIGETSLVSNYGIVISLNWLMKKQKMSPESAIKLVLSACRELYSKGLIDVVKKATECYSPYPSFLVFKSPQKLMDKIDKNVILTVDFNNDSKYIFLR